MASKNARKSLPELECACATVRRAARLVTQLYSEEMGRDVEPAQFSLLSILSKLPGASQAKLGQVLGLDKTTLSRNLRLLERNGWIKLKLSDDDHRERGYQLTAAGKKVFATAKSGWTRAQAKLRGTLKLGEWEGMFKTLDRVAGAAIGATKRGKTHGQ